MDLLGVDVLQESRQCDERLPMECHGQCADVHDKRVLHLVEVGLELGTVRLYLVHGTQMY